MFNTGLTDSVERHNKRPTDAPNMVREELKILNRLHRENMIRIQARIATGNA